MKVNIKNYTSTVSADKSISRIEAILVEMGAERIHKGYKEGRLESISFSMKVDQNIIPFQLPAQVEVIEKIFLSQYKYRATEVQKRNAREQAERTAWKLIQEWVHIQSSMIRLQQAEFLEVFLPYVYRVESQTTFFKSLKESNYKALLN